MTTTRENRVSRAYSFTFDEEGEKELYHAHAKRRGLTLAGLIKSLLAEDRAKLPPPPPAAAAAGAA